MATTLASTWEWMRRKQVQIEVTFAVYMFTPWEKFTFCRFPPPVQLPIGMRYFSSATLC